MNPLLPILTNLLKSRVGKLAVTAVSRAQTVASSLMSQAKTPGSPPPIQFRTWNAPTPPPLPVAQRAAHRPALFQRAINYFRGTPAQPLTPTQLNQAPKGGFAALAAQPGNFAALLSGRITPQQAVQQQNRQNAPQGTPGFGSIAGSVIRGAAGFAASNPAIAATALVGVFGALLASGKRLAEGQLESLRYLTRFNGAIAVAYARLGRGDILRSRASGLATQGTTGALVSAMNEMRDTWRPIKDLGTNILNVVGTFAVKIVTMLGKPLEAMVRFFDWFMGTQKPQRQLLPWEQAILDLAKEHRASNVPRAGRAK